MAEAEGEGCSVRTQNGAFETGRRRRRGGRAFEGRDTRQCSSAGAHAGHPKKKEEEGGDRNSAAALNYVGEDGNGERS